MWRRGQAQGQLQIPLGAHTAVDRSEEQRVANEDIPI